MEYPTLSPGHRRRFSRRVLAWYERHGRTLPWRNCDDQYHVLLSEIMLQQTQVSRVLVKHPEFLRRFPTLRSLSRARKRDVVIAWRGMGYNNRAVRLHRLARTLVEHHRGMLPDTYEALVALPGIGRYTANALLASVHGNDVPVVDINVRRFLSRAFWSMRSPAALRPETEIWQVASAMVPRGQGYSWSQALMDLGATICTARRPACEQCPVAAHCSSRSAMHMPVSARPARRPVAIVPDRIYRGRIIEKLRAAGGTGIPARTLAEAVHPGFTVQDETWLNGILASLERDGLIALQGPGRRGRRRIALA